MFHLIKISEDITNFINKTNSLHDGYIVGVKYTNEGVSKTEHGYCFNPIQTKLCLQILVTSILDTTVEIEFENVLEWQIGVNQFDITDTSIIITENQHLMWIDDVYTNIEDAKKGSYVIAKSIKWRIIK